jgi:mono/diheme cytochrome c family protein
VTRPKLLAAAGAGAIALAAAGCGATIKTSEQGTNPVHEGAVLFNERCSGCHTLSAAGTHGSAAPGHVAQKERTDGPNLDYRRENPQDVLFAIRNGGFSGAIMPANIVVGPDADKVAQFVSKYAGSKASSTQAPTQAQ